MKNLVQKLVMLAALAAIILACGATAFAAEETPEPAPLTRGEVFYVMACDPYTQNAAIGPITWSFKEDAPLPFDDLDYEVNYEIVTAATICHWAKEVGLVFGTGNNKFEPNRPITREEWAVLWMRYMIIVDGADFGPAPSEAELQAILGDADISGWAREHYYNAVKHGFMAEVGDPKGYVYYDAYGEFYTANYAYYKEYLHNR